MTEKQVDPLAAIEEATKQAGLMRELAMKLLPEEARQAVLVAKQNNVEPYVIQLGDSYFIYRTINRLEYKNLLLSGVEQTQALIEQAPSEAAGRIIMNIRSEDEIVIKCCLWPQLDLMSIKTLPAGYIETIHNTIMATSGFNQEPMPIKL